jgi:predicted transcriptional regulator
MPDIRIKKTNISQQKIAIIIGVSQSAISRELLRNTGNRGYRLNKLKKNKRDSHFIIEITTN